MIRTTSERKILRSDIIILLLIPLVLITIVFLFLKDTTPVPSGYKFSEEWRVLKIKDVSTQVLGFDTFHALLFEDDSQVIISEDFVGMAVGSSIYTKNEKFLGRYLTVICGLKDKSTCVEVEHFENPKYDSITKLKGFIPGYSESKALD